MWTDPQAPRIWRYATRPGNSFQSDEALYGVDNYDDATLARVAAEGFNGIWLFCKLQDLMRSKVFPELNSPQAEARTAAIRGLAERAAKHGVGVYLYFNDPVGLDIDHPFWKAHPDLKGPTLWHMYAWCFSTPQVPAFFRDAVAGTLEQLEGVAGIFLITACEALTHCWSKVRLRQGGQPPECPRCRHREPAEIVTEMLSAWDAGRKRMKRPCRIMAWNWEWAYWYPDPQAAIVDRLPDGIELLLDMELGGTRMWRGRPQAIGEYSLAFVGPSQRLIATQDAVAPRGVPVHAKIQINATHELCTVPNLPVLRTVHAKMRAMTQRKIAGFLGAWSIGTCFTLNTFALKLFMRDPDRFMDERTFFAALAREYFGEVDAEAIGDAWARFSKAFEQYPVTIPMLYYGPVNDAPARRLSLRFEGKHAGRTFMGDNFGDDLSRSLDGLDLDKVIAAFTEMHAGWREALASYERAMAHSSDGTPEQAAHRREELSTARMTEVQLASVVNVFEFERERGRVMKRDGLRPPCTLPREAALLAIMAREAANAGRALPLVEADARLGFHQEFGGYKYDAKSIRAKIAAMEAEVGRNC
ncbi:MAG: hypothetical protein NTW19_09265 [Planctomycetota bacterium]|nr:hypothetical protein [Planctomycetota bacterium]